MGAKGRELKCLTDSLALCPTTRGETRRILQMLSMYEGDIDSERPDFILRVSRKGKSNSELVVGLEHFMVDQNSETQRKRKGVNSLGEKRRKQLEALQVKYRQDVVDGADLPDEAIGELFHAASGAIADSLNTSCVELIASFETVFLEHLRKVREYRRNVRRVAKRDDGIACGFLIELHSDLSRYFFEDGNSSRECVSGEALLLEEMVPVLEKAKGAIDFIVISFYSPTDSAPKNVLAFKCGNVRKSIEKQHVPICPYVGSDVFLEAFSRPKASVSVAEIEDEDNGDIKVTFEASGERLAYEDRFEFLLLSAAKAWHLARQGKPCVSDFLVHQFLTDYGDRIIGWKRFEGTRDDWRIRPIMVSSLAEQTGLMSGAQHLTGQ